MRQYDYRTLPIGKYIEVVKACNSDLDALDRQVKVIGIVYDMDERAVLNLPVETYREYSGAVEFLTAEDTNSHRVASVYRIGGFDLIPTRDLRHLTTAQYIDFQTLQKGGIGQLVELLSVLLVPKGMRYADGYDVADVQSAIRDNLCVTDALALSAFFLSRYNASMRSTLVFSEKTLRMVKDKSKRRELQMQIRREKLRLSLVGAGLRLWMR